MEIFPLEQIISASCESLFPREAFEQRQCPTIGPDIQEDLAPGS